MASERRPSLRAGFDGARPSADEGLGHFDVSRARQMIEIVRRGLPSVAPVSFLSWVKSRPSRSDRRRSAPP